MKNLFILCLIIFVSIVRGDIWKGNFTSTHFRANWTIDTVSADIIIDFNADTNGWVSFALGTLAGGGAMAGSDPYTGWVGDSTGTTSLFDTFATGHTIPNLDVNAQGTDDILAFSGHQTGGVTYLHFQRLLSTGDTAHDVAITNTNQYLIWAYGTADGNSGTSYAQHGTTTRGSQQLNFFMTLISQTSTTGVATTGAATTATATTAKMTTTAVVSTTAQPTTSTTGMATTATATTAMATTTGRPTTSTTGVATTAAKTTATTTLAANTTAAANNGTANVGTTLTITGSTLSTGVVAAASVGIAIVLLGGISIGVGVCFRMHEKRKYAGV